MSDFLQIDKYSTFCVNKKDDCEIIEKICRALSVKERIMILKCILAKTKSIKEISDETEIPFSSVARHVEILADAQLILISYKPGKKNHTKYCAQTIMGFNISLNTDQLIEEKGENYRIEMPVGMFTQCSITAPCGMVGKTEALIPFDDPLVFFSPRRSEAECIWFNKGFLTYNFPNQIYKKSECKELSLSFEVCSETVYYNNNWPSDITVFINDKEILTFTSPSDFGGRRGDFTPQYWPISSTQFGLLKNIVINETGVYLDKILTDKSITIKDLDINSNSLIKLTIGIKDESLHQGGLNLFGKNFGDYPQAIVMTLK